MTSPMVAFVAGDSGPWRVDRVEAVRGESLPVAPRLSIVEGSEAGRTGPARWVLRGAVSHERYVTRAEHERLAARQAPLGRAEASRAALIPISKSDAWWALAQDERRAIFEERSHHIAASLPYLPAVARRLHHGRDLGEPFDFLTWFEYAPEHSDAFEDWSGRCGPGPSGDTWSARSTFAFTATDPGRATWPPAPCGR